MSDSNLKGTTEKTGKGRVHVRCGGEVVFIIKKIEKGIPQTKHTGYYLCRKCRWQSAEFIRMVNNGRLAFAFAPLVVIVFLITGLLTRTAIDRGVDNETKKREYRNARNTRLPVVRKPIRRRIRFVPVDKYGDPYTLPVVRPDLPAGN